MHFMLYEGWYCQLLEADLYQALNDSHHESGRVTAAQA